MSRPLKKRGFINHGSTLRFIRFGLLSVATRPRLTPCDDLLRNSSQTLSNFRFSFTAQQLVVGSMEKLRVADAADAGAVGASTEGVTGPEGYAGVLFLRPFQRCDQTLQNRIEWHIASTWKDPVFV